MKVKGYTNTNTIAAVAFTVTACAAPAQDIVPGPWGHLKDHIKPLNISSDRERIILFRRQHMLAKSAHFRTIEAVVIYGAPFRESLGEEARALHPLVIQAVAETLRGALFQQLPLRLIEQFIPYSMWQDTHATNRLAAIAQSIRFLFIGTRGPSARLSCSSTMRGS